jgi:PhnB protein
METSMGKSKNPIPEGLHTITPHLTVKNAAQAIDFYKKAFVAT